MRNIWMAGCAGVAGMALAAPVAAQSPAPGQSPAPAETPVGSLRIQPPVALHRPTQAEMGPYPEEARRRGLSGRATMICEVRLSSRLDNCRITDEAPSGVGFGEALLRMAPAWRVAPARVGDEAVDREPVTIPMTFTLAPPPTKPAAPPATGMKVLRRPSESETEALYPEEARRHARQGHASMTCEVSLSSELRNCRITEEEPLGFGFGAALLQTAPLWRVAPPIVGGKPVDGAPVTVPMTFAFSLDTAARQLEHPEAKAPLRRVQGVVWVPLLFAALALMGLAFASLGPLPRRRPRPRPGQFA